MSNEIKFYCLGLMSGTSLDGVDVALVEVTGKRKKTNEDNPFDEDYDYSYKLKGYYLSQYDQNTKKEILKVSTEKISIGEVSSLNKKLGVLYKNAVDEALDYFKLTPYDIEFIGVHGQTVFHDPKGIKGYPSTLQLGDMSYLSYMYNKTIVYNFRPMDISAGGSGAPLVPKSEEILHYNKNYNQILVNIGGITNITYLSKEKKIISFDTGPGNMLIDDAMRRFYGKDYDEDGHIARSGKIDKQVLTNLLNDPYLKESYPKSTGREYYNKEYLDKIIEQMTEHNPHKKLCKEDLIATLTAYTAYHLTGAIKRFFPQFGKKDHILINGGGAHNHYMMEMIEESIDAVVEKNENNMYIDAKEAMAFAILAHLTLEGKPGNVPSATGAKDEVILGSVIYPKESEEYYEEI